MCRSKWKRKEMIKKQMNKDMVCAKLCRNLTKKAMHNLQGCKGTPPSMLSQTTAFP
jgi:hypothetical protein